jgi:hypothetical protein
MAEEEKPRRPEKVSKSDAANEIVELLRQVAHKVIALGDGAVTRCTQLEEELDNERHDHAALQEQWAVATLHEEEFAEWEGLLLDFRSGIRDRDELLAGTVGVR